MATTELAIPQRSIAQTREEFGAVQHNEQYETATQAIATQAAKAVEARYIMAERHPRKLAKFRERMIELVELPEFARKAEYAKPVGKKWDPEKGENIEQFAHGPSIRFIESCVQNFGNLLVQSMTIFDNEQARIVKVAVTDLETNGGYEEDVFVAKTVERKATRKNKNAPWEPPKGRELLSQRLNSYGDPVFTCRATDDEVTFKTNNLKSKSIRTQGQRLLPADVVEALIQRAREVVAEADRRDPRGAVKNIVASFGKLDVAQIDLENYLGHLLSAGISEDEMSILRKLWVAIDGGETTWAEIMAGREGSAEDLERVRQQKLADAEAFKQQTAGNAPPAAQEPAQDSLLPKDETPAPSTGKYAFGKPKQ